MLLPLTFATRELPLSLSPQNRLDHHNGQCKPKSRHLGDLKLHEHFDIFPYFKPKYLGTSEMANHML